MEKYIKFYPLIVMQSGNRESRAYDIGLTNSLTVFKKSDAYMDYLVYSVDEVLDGSAPCQLSLINDLRNFIKKELLMEFIELI